MGFKMEGILKGIFGGTSVPPLSLPLDYNSFPDPAPPPAHDSLEGDEEGDEDEEGWGRGVGEELVASPLISSRLVTPDRGLRKSDTFQKWKVWLMGLHFVPCRSQTNAGRGLANSLPSPFNCAESLLYTHHTTTAIHIYRDFHPYGDPPRTEPGRPHSGRLWFKGGVVWIECSDHSASPPQVSTSHERE
jgi:hypothetical protein